MRKKVKAGQNTPHGKQPDFNSFLQSKTSEVVITNLGSRGEVFVQGPEAVLEAIVAQVSHPDLFSVGRPGKRNSIFVSQYHCNTGHLIVWYSDKIGLWVSGIQMFTMLRKNTLN